jgi:hypothetical protein
VRWEEIVADYLCLLACGSTSDDCVLSLSDLRGWPTAELEEIVYLLTVFLILIDRTAILAKLSSADLAISRDRPVSAYSLLAHADSTDAIIDLARQDVLVARGRKT